MPVRELQRQLADNGIELSREYLTKLVKKQERGLAHRFDCATAKKAVAQIHDVLTETTRRIWPILLAKTSTNKEKISAAAEIRGAHMTAFKLARLANILEEPAPGSASTSLWRKEDETTEQLVADLRKLWGYPPQESTTGSR